MAKVSLRPLRKYSISKLTGVQNYESLLPNIGLIILQCISQMVSHKPFLAKISNINTLHITQYFWVKSYKRNQWNLPNILAYILGIFNYFFKGGS